MKQVTSRQLVTAVGMALLGQSAAALLLQTLAPLAALLESDLNLSKMDIGLLSAATSTGSWTTVFVGGMLADRFGVRKVMSMSMMAAGSLMLLMMSVGSLLQAMIVLFVASVARGAVFPSSTKAVLEWFPPQTRATAMGIKQMGMPIAGTLAGSALPTIALAMGWRSAMMVSAVLVIVSGIVAAATYRNAPELTRVSSRAVGMGVALREMIRSPIMVGINSAGFCLFLVQLASLTYLPLYFKEVVLVTALPDNSARIVAAGGFLAVCQLGTAVARILWGVVSDRFFAGRRNVAMVIICALATVMLFIMGNLGSGTPLWLLTVFAFVFGSSVAGWVGVFNALLAESFARKHAATAVGLSMTVTELGTIAGPPFFGMVLDMTYSYQTAWFLTACVCVIGTAITAMVVRPGRTEAQLLSQRGG